MDENRKKSKNTIETVQRASNDFANLTYTQKVSTHCRENIDEIWSMQSDSIINVCTYICTVTTNIYEGDKLFDSSSQDKTGACE